MNKIEKLNVIQTNINLKYIDNDKQKEKISKKNKKKQEVPIDEVSRANEFIKQKGERK